MRLEKNLWILDGWYIDFDELDQFRIIGPNNHLYCGLIDIPKHKIKIKSFLEKNDVLYVKGEFCCSSINLYYPAMDDIRTMRELKFQYGQENPLITFLEIRRRFFDKLVPTSIQTKKIRGEICLTFRRQYGEDKWYGVEFRLPSKIKIKKITLPYRGYNLKSREKNITFTIKTETNDIHKQKFERFFVKNPIDFSIFKSIEKKSNCRRTVRYFWQRTNQEIEHLIKWGKTSGDSYGTIFPRDWMEAADLGVHDLQPEVREYMYQASLKNINQEGLSWHEDVVGEYKFQHEIAGRDIFDRHMIDIEPHHLKGLAQLSENFLLNPDNKEKIRKVAKYLLKQARQHHLITFKRVPETKDKYFATGNWRDSEWAFKQVNPLIAPFDVNAVFYPEALKVLKKFQGPLGLKIPDINKLIKKWSKVKDLYRFKNKDGLTAYALALYGICLLRGKTSCHPSISLRAEKLKVNHLDESYLYTYSEAPAKEIVSFCKRLLNKNYFYTPSGPLLIAKNNNLGYTTTEYHGLVIWTKQVAFVILGLSKHLKRGIQQKWDKETLKLIKKTILITCENMIRTFAELGTIPELHYDKNGQPRFFTDQPYIHGQMSKVQLWSAIGARRIFRKYWELMTNKEYKI